MKIAVWLGMLIAAAFLVCLIITDDEEDKPHA
jgi:hypothetical protein